MANIWCVSLATLLLTSVGCLGRSSPPASGEAPIKAGRAYRIPGADRPPESLLQVGEMAIDVFDAASSSDWHQSTAGLQSLKEAASEFPVDLLRPDLVAKLQSNLVAVCEATNTKQRVPAMYAANEITQIVAELASQYQPAVPYDVKMLGYYGRQIQLGVASGRPADSARAVSDLVTVWDRTEPVIVRRGHAGEADRFTDLVVELIAAKRPDDFVAPVRAELAAGSRLERIFISSQ